jgi:hypothetical protein
MSGAQAEGLTSDEQRQIERMVAADPAAAFSVMTDVILAALKGAAQAGITPAEMVVALETTSNALLDAMAEKGLDPLPACRSPRRAV